MSLKQASRYVLLLLPFLLSACHLKAQDKDAQQQQEQQQADNKYPPYDPDAPELKDIQRTIDDAMDDVEDSLNLHGRFQPFAVVILKNDSIAEIHAKNMTDSFSYKDLEEELTIDALQGNYKVVSIFYLADTNDETKETNTSVVAIHAEHTDDEFAYHFEYPYTKSANHKVVFRAPTAGFEDQVMYKP